MRECEQGECVEDLHHDESYFRRCREEHFSLANSDGGFCDQDWQRFYEERAWVNEGTINSSRDYAELWVHATDSPGCTIFPAVSFKRDGEDCPKGSKGAYDYFTPTVRKCTTNLLPALKLNETLEQLRCAPFKISLQYHIISLSKDGVANLLEGMELGEREKTVVRNAVALVNADGKCCCLGGLGCIGTSQGGTGTPRLHGPVSFDSQAAAWVALHAQPSSPQQPGYQHMQAQRRQGAKQGDGTRPTDAQHACAPKTVMHGSAMRPVIQSPGPPQHPHARAHAVLHHALRRLCGRRVCAADHDHQGARVRAGRAPQPGGGGVGGRGGRGRQGGPGVGVGVRTEEGRAEAGLGAACLLPASCGQGWAVRENRSMEWRCGGLGPGG